MQPPRPKRAGHSRRPRASRLRRGNLAPPSRRQSDSRFSARASTASRSGSSVSSSPKAGPSHCASDCRRAPDSGITVWRQRRDWPRRNWRGCCRREARAAAAARRRRARSRARHTLGRDEIQLGRSQRERLPVEPPSSSSGRPALRAPWNESSSSCFSRSNWASVSVEPSARHRPARRRAWRHCRAAPCASCWRRCGCRARSLPTRRREAVMVVDRMKQRQMQDRRRERPSS